MKVLTPVIAALGLAAGAANAQPPGLPLGGRFDLDNLATLLDLDPYQKNEVERVMTEQREALRAERDARRGTSTDAPAPGERPSRDEMFARREQTRAQLFDNLKNTLTEQQLAKLKILMEPPQGGRGPRGPAL
jgi:hypothetical protein